MKNPLKLTKEWLIKRGAQEEKAASVECGPVMQVDMVYRDYAGRETPMGRIEILQPLASEVAPGPVTETTDTELLRLFFNQSRVSSINNAIWNSLHHEIMGRMYARKAHAAQTEPQGAEAPAERASDEAYSECSDAAVGLLSIIENADYDEGAAAVFELRKLLPNLDKFITHEVEDSAAAPRPQEPLAEVFSEFRRRFEQFSNYIPADDRVRYLLPALDKLSQLMLRPQEPRCPQCDKSEFRSRVVDREIFRIQCTSCKAIFDLQMHNFPAECAQFFSPAQSPQWISVKKRLPEITERWKDGPNQYESSGWVLAHYHYGQTVAEYYGREDGWADHSGQLLRDVTHWQPLPEPPAQSQGAAPETGKLETLLNIGPLCSVCGTIMTRKVQIGEAEKRAWACLSCGATTSCTEGDKK